MPCLPTSPESAPYTRPRALSGQAPLLEQTTILPSKQVLTAGAATRGGLLAAVALPQETQIRPTIGDGLMGGPQGLDPRIKCRP
jgi:hypothetical protein